MSSSQELRQRLAALDLLDSAGRPVEVETALGIKLPDEVKRIASFFAGDLVGGISHFPWTTDNDWSVVAATQRAREAQGIGSTSFILLAEPAESVVVLRVDGSPAVIWCDASDFGRVVKGEAPTADDAEIFDTYVDFIEYLVSEEEDERSN